MLVWDARPQDDGIAAPQGVGYTVFACFSVTKAGSWQNGDAAWVTAETNAKVGGVLDQETNESGELAPEASLPPDELFTGAFSISEALEKLRLRLLDLTARNRLLNFKPTAAKSLQFVEGRLSPCYQKLVESSDRRIPLHPVPEPRRLEFVEKLGRLVRPDVRDYARAQGISTTYELADQASGEKEIQGVRALLYPDELERHCRKMATAAKTAIEETGANMLFLLLGFLEFPEAPNSNKILLAPLVPVPVSLDKGDLDRATGTYRYSLSYTGEELTENLSLREKLKQDFNVELPDFTEESTLDSYYQELARAIDGKPSFKLRRQATLALVSMTKMLLVRDLDPKNWPKIERESALMKHDIVKMVFEGAAHGDGSDDDDNEEYIVDFHKHAGLPLIFDADSSQHSALIDAIDGKNLVIEGPPGTGKSQTITNLVACAISSGKKVLFVAEKLAALQVVKSRLSKAGLGDFCLELHSNKTSKKDVLDSIQTRAGKRYTKPSQLDAMLEALKEKRRTLTNYVELINTQSGNAQGLTIHQVLWRAERYRQKAGEAWRRAQKITVERASELTAAEFDSFYDQLARLVQEHERIGTYGPAAPFWGFFASSLPPAAEVEIEQALTTAVPAVEALRDCYTAAASVLDAAKLALSKEEAKELAVSLLTLSSFAKESMAEEILPRLFEDPYTRGHPAETVLRRLVMQQGRAKEFRVEFEGKVDPHLIVDGDLRKEGPRTLTTLRNLGISKLTPDELEALGARCRSLATEGRMALDEFRVLATVAGQEFKGSDHCVSRVGLPIELSTSCPRNELHRRSPELASPGSAKIILDAKQRYTTMSKRQAELEERLYMDTAVAERDVEEIVQVFREGDEWWRFVQSRHRSAVAFHKRLAKIKKVTKSVRREELEALHAHLKETRLAREDLRYRKAMGGQWNAGATEFDALHAVAFWIETANTKLLDAELDASTFSPLTVTAAQVASLSKSGDRLARAQELLNGCFKHVTEGALKDASATNTTFRHSKTWQERLQLLDTLGERLIQQAQMIGRWGPSSQPSESIILALRALNDLQQVEQDVNRDQEAKALLKNRHKGLHSDLEPLFQALTYGRAVLDLSLPEDIYRVLLSDRGNASRRELIHKLAEIEKAWQPVEAFCDFLGARGRFELAQWAGTEPSAPTFIDGFLDRIQKAKGGVGGLLQWVQYIHAAEFAVERGLKEYVDLLESEGVPRQQVPEVYGYRFYGTIAEALFEKHKLLEKFSSLSHDAVRNEFRKLDHDIIELRGHDVAAMAASLARPPAGSTGPRVVDKTEKVLLQYLYPQARPRLPIRKMMIQAGRAIQQYKPCFMMGPQAVAQYLAPGALEFDIVVMDEASQLKPEEALGAIARGKQLIVVGDPKQLPPTTFFDKLGETQDDDDSKEHAAVMQPSILEVCMGHFRPVRTLRWHYRSQHQSLIAFSNARFYRNNLIVFPSPYERSRNLGCKLRYIPGATYDSQMNIKEANVVVEAVLVHMRERPGDSLGVVTLNLKQRELIDELLQKRVRDLDYVDAFSQAHEKEGFGFFVKNLENVQGDERDVIFISTTFGPAPGTNSVFQRFGPISRHDGWRRLNVLFTRARKSLTVFTSMRPEDIVDGENVPKGRRELRAYLEYLRTGIVPQTTGAEGPPDSDFEIAVMDALERYGYSCTPQLGVAGYRIDLAVNHPRYPGTYLAAIECDGAAYHSGRSARDRDRIRQEILERLGWKGRIQRIWSTDWYRAPAHEIGRLVSWLEKLKAVPMDEAYLVAPEPDLVAPASTPLLAAAKAQASTEATLEDLGVTIDADEPLEVQVGDKVTYVNLGQDKEATITIGTRRDEPRGMIDYNTPLAEALLGLQEGEIAPLVIQGRPTVRLRIVKIERAGETAQAT